MVKEIKKIIKLQVPAGRATPGPPVGTALGPAGVNSQEFCTRFNEETKEKMGDVLPVVISIYDDRSFSFKIKTPPAAFLIKKFAKVNKAGAKGKTEKVGSITRDQLKEIAEIKAEDLNAYDVEKAMKIIAGTALNMGIEIVD